MKVKDLKIIPDPRQRDVERLIDALRPVQLQVTHYRGGMLRAAIAAGWILEPANEYKPGENGKLGQYLIDGVEVGDLEPWRADLYGKQVADLYDELMQVPKA